MSESAVPSAGVARRIKRVPAAPLVTRSATIESCHVSVDGRRGRRLWFVRRLNLPSHEQRLLAVVTMRSATAILPLLLLVPLAAVAQGVTSAGIRGSVSTSDAQPVDALIHVLHTPTGFAVEARAPRGRFLVQ